LALSPMVSMLRIAPFGDEEVIGSIKQCAEAL
jgi:hypothetical protein